MVHDWLQFRVLQAWMFVGGHATAAMAKAFITAVPTGRILLLDLYSEKIPVFKDFESFYGQPFVWNLLHNFGGISQMRGSLREINDVSE